MPGSERQQPVHGDGWVRFDVSTAAHPDTWAIVDAEDWLSISADRWSATKRANGLYVRHRRHGLLHRHLLAPNADLTIDHRDGDPLNNRRANLRECSQGDNNRFGADRRRGYSIETEIVSQRTRDHVVTAVLADGTSKEYRYPTRSKVGTKQVTIRKRSAPR